MNRVVSGCACARTCAKIVRIRVGDEMDRLRRIGMAPERLGEHARAQVEPPMPMLITVRMGLPV